jgi:transposase-like protein
VSQPWREGVEAWRRLVGRSTSGDAALDALSDVGLVRRMMDEVELQAVRDARRAGRSWTEIATRLGMTRQSAWERWRELDEKPAPPTALDQATREAAEELVTARARVTVPDVVGLSWPAAQHRLIEEHLHAVLADPQLLPLVGPEADDFLVVDQKPAAGDRVAQASPVTLWLHRGPGSAGVRAPLPPPPSPRVRRGAIDETTGDSVR